MVKCKPLKTILKPAKSYIWLKQFSWKRVNMMYCPFKLKNITTVFSELGVEMSKNTSSNAFRRIDVDQYAEDNYKVTIGFILKGGFANLTEIYSWQEDSIGPYNLVPSIFYKIVFYDTFKFRYNLYHST